jgi:cellulose biosynthesis protein BcsQ
VAKKASCLPCHKIVVTFSKTFFAHNPNMKTIAIYNIKGGVGKTTTTINIACLLAKMNLSVLVWDLDAQGGTSFFFDKEHQNNQNLGKLFSGYISIYDVIKPADTYHIDIIANDTLFSDQFINHASQLTKLDFFSNQLVKNVLSKVNDDYDVVIIDCPPGKFTMHDNVFCATDLLLVPNIPAPLSMYCNDMLLAAMQKLQPSNTRIFSFFNLVQMQKKLHKMYLNSESSLVHQLENYIPFYTEIETISQSKTSIFHQLKDSKSILYYENLWDEICIKMGWDMFRVYKGKVVELNPESAITYSEIAMISQSL